ncbi:hypothetical protein C491_15027 [Natronococcus amylolyticus DSM 10524]|uniref:Uncharacterized protein n=1 Tax=Natronococcus amylolyticus DSM 10524 TaxID=1227497 RepID=L9X476_9EURY|nr:hypothetical protein C491_15027 [Natronococcus amylolyticus DSM 10524]
MATRISDRLNEVTPARSAVLCDDAVKIEFRIRGKISECFEHIPTVASRIARRRMDVVFTAVDRERVCQLRFWLIERVDDTDSDELALVLRITSAKRLKIGFENTLPKIDYRVTRGREFGFPSAST